MAFTPYQLFHLLADASRLRSVVLLAREGELCVCELTHALELSQPKVSRHLALLRRDGVVQDRRAGQWVYYRLHPELPAWARQVIDAALRAAVDQQPFHEDAQRLRSMPERPAARCCT